MSKSPYFQDLSLFKVPASFRGRSKFFVQCWWIIQASLFSMSPQFMYGWRAFLLRLFGAKIGKGVIIRPSVRITYPWKLKIGDHSWIGDNVELYTLGEIEIGDNTVISQRSYICTGSHKHDSQKFDIFAEKIIIEDECWLATDVFVAPGTLIGKGAVVGARSSVFSDIPKGEIYAGNPAKQIKKRTQNN